MNTRVMNTRNLLRQINGKQPAISQETGQSIVLIALALVAIIGFMGIALDVGFVFARGSQLQAAIDAAALAGVTELGGWSPTNPGGNGVIEGRARTKSAQFLNANGMPISVTLSLSVDENLFVARTPLGATQYAVTATWPVETFFLKVLGFTEPVNLSRSATAAVFSLANVYASRRIEDGIISTSNQAVFGPNSCTSMGDPFSPVNSPWAPGLFTYQYRIMIPSDYENRANTSIVRVELFDPDSINAPNLGTPFTIQRSQNAIDAGLSATTTGSCTSSQVNPCLVPTGELPLYDNGTLPLERINPFFFWRIDENRTAATSTNAGCNAPNNYNAQLNTRTSYELFYWRQNPDGTVVRQDLANYWGQTGNGTTGGDGAPDNGQHDTDLRWVSPGAAQSFDQPAFVPANNCSSSACDFEIDLALETPNILVEQGSGIRYINLEVTTIAGSSENGFETWAGPPTYIDVVPSDANDRNLYALNDPGSHTSEGATVFATGNLPMNSNVNFPVDIPLVYFGPEYAGQDVYVSLFDTDSGSAPPITFSFDSIAVTDWRLTFAQAGIPDPDGETGRCIMPGCNNQWVDPPYLITVPGDTSNCDYSIPGDPNCIPFYGGRLVARYDGGNNDTYAWQITVNGLPYLVR